MRRRSSSPEVPIPEGQVHGTRRRGGFRREASERVWLRHDAFETEGWTLNVSRGGARVVVESAVELGGTYAAIFDDTDNSSREVRVVWIQDEDDGQIVGLQFLDVEGSVPPPDDGARRES